MTPAVSVIFSLRAKNGGEKGWVRNIKQLGEGRLSAFGPRELRTSGHIQKNVICVTGRR